MKKLTIICALFSLLVISTELLAKRSKKSANRVSRKTTKRVTKRYAKTNSRSLSSVGGQKKAIQVRGQTRTMSMGLVLKNKKEQIDFIKPRDNYDEEIINTNY